MTATNMSPDPAVYSDDENVRRGRISELDLLEEAQREARRDAFMGRARPLWLAEHINARREAIQKEGD